MRKRMQRATADAARSRGFTLVEVLIAIGITLFLLGGIFTIMQNTRRGATAQNGATQLQDNARLALTILTDTIQQAGYFPNATQFSPWSQFQVYTGGGSSFATPPLAPSVVQTIGGTGVAWNPAATVTTDTLSLRFATASGDGTLNCLGGTNTSGNPNPETFVELFQIDGAGNLTCTVTTLTLALTTYTQVASTTGILIPAGANGVKSLQFMYGVKTNAAAAGNCADSYLDVTQIGANWPQVVSVMVLVGFSNPTTATGLPLVQFSRVVNLMNQAGVTL